MPRRAHAHAAVAAHLLVSAFVAAAAAAAATYNVIDYGAVGDDGGVTDSARAFEAAWAAACAGDAAAAAATVVVPAGGVYLVSRARFAGPCRSGAVAVNMTGATVVAPVPYAGVQLWIVFQDVDGVSVAGGTLDGRGRALWACRRARRPDCPPATRSLTIYRSRNVAVRGLTSRDSAGIHITVQASAGVAIVDTVVSAPGRSPNTDGIHIKQSTGVTVRNAVIGTGDDCVSMVEGSSDVLIEAVTCGPGHGISIGSLGDTPEQVAVRNITVKGAALAGTTNGLRIKTWAKANAGAVAGVSFSGVVMRNGSGIEISGVSYTDIEGTSATATAVRFDCSPSRPCAGIAMRDVRLRYQPPAAAAEEEQPAASFCRNAHGVAFGDVDPPSCLTE
uniref:Endopolygalacturonase n=2 Tax=Oryza TaxID=4527 RepID=Q53JL0_ORYSJ|nr:endopolygalacturonase [Oryza sativa Japonica Group]